jgi:outer membrane cobalamin receptor
MLDEVVVMGSKDTLQGFATSASEGSLNASQLRSRPLSRVGDLFETVPGLQAAQHSGEGKANQLFLRGFNLDHGTDFATYVDGVRINFSTHAHGQGYTDAYFLIPEIVQNLRFRKGPYDAEDGDFSAVGSIRFGTINRVAQPLLVMEGGGFGYRRALGLSSSKIGGADWLVAAEKVSDDGPWAVRQNLDKINLFTKLSSGSANHGWSLSYSHYRASWTSSDQVPQRAIDQGLINRYGTLDPSTGGATQRQALTANWAERNNGTQRLATAYLIAYDFDLFSNFTYFTRGCESDPLLASCNGRKALDQFQQRDRRNVFGINVSQKTTAKWFGHDGILTIGTDLRHDSIRSLGLYDTNARLISLVVREDQAKLDALALWLKTETLLSDKLRLHLGARWDYQHIAVNSRLQANSGQRSDAMLSPKFSLNYSPSNTLDLYLNYGQGFHSNDARGTVIKVDPRDPSQSQSSATPMVRVTGYEFGMRQNITPLLSSTFALWKMHLGSELLFVGDAGSTEASRPGTRQGIEWSLGWQANKSLRFDADINLTKSTYSDYSAGGKAIPGAVPRMISLGATFNNGHWSVGATVRHLGARPLLEDNLLQSRPSNLASIKASYRLSQHLEASLEVFNLFNSQIDDSSYAYASRLPGEAAFSSATAASLHVHPGAPRTLRVGLKASF